MTRSALVPSTFVVLLCFAAAIATPMGCSRPPSGKTYSAPAGTLQGTVSVQVTAAQDKKLLILDSAELAEILSPYLRQALREKDFEIAGESAEQHLVVHVSDAARGSGSVNATCTLEVYVYDSWPGNLHPKKNASQEPDGSLSSRASLLHFSLNLKDQRRLRLDPESSLKKSVSYFSQEIATELVKIREGTPRLRIASGQKAVATSSEKQTQGPAETRKQGFEVMFELAAAPGNLTLTPTGKLFISLHQFFDPDFSVAEVTPSGKLRRFAQEAALDSVLGIQSDENGVVWMLDNGMKSTGKPRLVGWHSVRDKLVADIDLSGVAPENAFFNDLVIDLDHQHAYLADPAGGQDAAIVVVDLNRKSVRRVLEGHASVIPQSKDLIIDGKPLRTRNDDGTFDRPHVGINPIAADANNTWLYYGPMHSTTLYRIKTEHLRDSTLSQKILGEKVERFAEKPISDGMSLDRLGNVYLGALADNAIWRISPDGSAEVVAKHALLSWVDAFSFGPDGRLYAVVNQLHRSPQLNAGELATDPPYLVIAFSTPVPGVIGR